MVKILLTLLVIVPLTLNEIISIDTSVSDAMITIDGTTYSTTKCLDYPFNAGNTFINSGTVKVCNDLDNLYLGITVPEGFQQEKTDQIKLWVGQDGQSPPRNPANNVAPGALPIYSGFLTSTQWGIVIPFSNGMTCSSLIFSFIHGDVFDPSKTAQTAWAGDTCISAGDKQNEFGSSWICYLNYQAECPVGSCIGPTCDCGLWPNNDHCVTANTVCGTAYAYGTHVFSRKVNNPRSLSVYEQLGFSSKRVSNRWGWVTLMYPGTQTQNIYMGAGRNIISDDKIVGTAIYSFDNSAGTVEINIEFNAGVTSEIFHIYVSDEPPKYVDVPGLYMDHADGPGDFSNTYDVTDVDGDGIWIIVHTAVCREE